MNFHFRHDKKIKTMVSTHTKRAHGEPAVAVRSGGPQFEVLAPLGHGWDSKVRNRLTGNLKANLGSYPPRHLDALRRASEANYAMLGMVEHGDTAKYIKMINCGCQFRWLPRDSWASRATDVSIIDTVHILLVNSADGSSQLRHTEILKYCGPAIKTLFLHSSGSIDVLEILEKCPNLTTLSLSECHVDDALIHGIVACQCASSIAGIRLSMCKGGMSAMALGALVDAAGKTLVWLDVVDAFFQDPNNETLNHSSWLGPLGRCSQLRTAILPKVDAAALGMLASPISKIE